MIAYIICSLIGAAIAIAAYTVIQRIVLNGRKNEIIAQAEVEAQNIKNEKIHQAKEKFLQLKSEHDKYVNDKNSQLKDAENRIRQKEQNLNQQNNELQKKIRESESARQSFIAQQENLAKKEDEYEKKTAQVNKQLEVIAAFRKAGCRRERQRRQDFRNMRRERVSTSTSSMVCPVVGQFVTGESIQGIVVSGLHRVLVLRNLPKLLNSASQAGINVKITK